MARTFKRKAKTTTESPEFEAWLSEVDAICQRRLSLGLFDLPDLLTRDAFDAGTSAAEFFAETVVPAIREDHGELVDDALAETADIKGSPADEEPWLEDFDAFEGAEFGSILFEDA